MAARAVAAEWKQSHEQLNVPKANESPTVNVELLRDRLEEAHRHVRNVLATAIRYAQYQSSVFESLFCCWC